MEDWEKKYRDKLTEELSEKHYLIKYNFMKPSYSYITGKQGYIDHLVSIRGSFRECLECGKLKMIGVQCKDPLTNNCNLDGKFFFN